MSNMKEEDKRRTLYEFEWQLLRVSLHFTDEAAVQKSLTSLDMYLTRHNHRPRALYKVINLMAATAMGLHSLSSANKSPELLKMIQDYRIKARVLYDKHERRNDEEEWMTNNDDRILELRNYSLADIGKVHKSLIQRWKIHVRRTSSSKENTRPELSEYLTLLAREVDSRR